MKNIMVLTLCASASNLLSLSSSQIFKESKLTCSTKVMA